MHIRLLTRDEVHLVWTIDRRELIERLYHMVDGALVLTPERYDMQGWPPNEAETYTPLLLDCFDRGGAFYGAFEDERLAGVVVLESHFMGTPPDQLQLKFLHVSRDDRGTGLGRRLFELAAERARSLGAGRLYVSATPSEHTVGFYMRMGCTLAVKADPELYALEPDDIHLECRL